jgi:hypothetical protein
MEHLLYRAYSSHFSYRRSERTATVAARQPQVQMPRT